MCLEGAFRKFTIPLRVYIVLLTLPVLLKLMWVYNGQSPVATQVAV